MSYSWCLSQIPDSIKKVVMVADENGIRARPSIEPSVCVEGSAAVEREDRCRTKHRATIMHFGVLLETHVSPGMGCFQKASGGYSMSLEFPLFRAWQEVIPIRALGETAAKRTMGMVFSATARCTTFGAGNLQPPIILPLAAPTKSDVKTPNPCKIRIRIFSSGL